jgi:hypothetical protein
MNILKYSFFLSTALILGLVSSCSSDDKVDKEKPTIDLSLKEAFPTNCDTIYFGKPFTVKMLLKDNIELGSYNIEIHNNFDHHTHSTEFGTCHEDPNKAAVNAYTFVKDYSIPTGLATHEISIPLTIPKGNGTKDYDPGDYHFQIKVTDKEGWSVLKGLNVKILH